MGRHGVRVCSPAFQADPVPVREARSRPARAPIVVIGNAAHDVGGHAQPATSSSYITGAQTGSSMASGDQELARDEGKARPIRRSCSALRTSSGPSERDGRSGNTARASSGGGMRCTVARAESRVDEGPVRFALAHGPFAISNDEGDRSREEGLPTRNCPPRLAITGLALVSPSVVALPGPLGVVGIHLQMVENPLVTAASDDSTCDSTLLAPSARNRRDRSRCQSRFGTRGYNEGARIPVLQNSGSYQPGGKSAPRGIYLARVPPNALL
jgi:hypothetical protein